MFYTLSPRQGIVGFVVSVDGGWNWAVDPNMYSAEAPEKYHNKLFITKD
jgi:hypothetical protein